MATVYNSGEIDPCFCSDLLIAEKRIVKRQVTIEEAQMMQRNGGKQATQVSSQQPFVTSSSSSFITREPSNVIRPLQYR